MKPQWQMATETLTTFGPLRIRQSRENMKVCLVFCCSRGDAYADDLSTSGPPYLSTVKKLDSPPDNLFFRLTATPMKTQPVPRFVGYRIQPHVIAQGRNVGRSAMWIPTTDDPGTELWVRPYFDPAARELRFQGKDGKDLPNRRSLRECADNPGLRPLLYLAQSEGLINKLPGGLCFGTFVALNSSLLSRFDQTIRYGLFTFDPSWRAGIPCVYLSRKPAAVKLA